MRVSEFTQDSELCISLFDKRGCKGLQHKTLVIQTNVTNKREQV